MKINIRYVFQPVRYSLLPAQLQSYLMGFNNRFQWLVENHLAGRERNDVHPGHRSFPEGRQFIFFITNDDWVDINDCADFSGGSHLT